MLPSAGSVPKPPVGTGTGPTPKLSASVQQTNANRQAPPELPSPAGTAEPPGTARHANCAESTDTAAAPMAHFCRPADYAGTFAGSAGFRQGPWRWVHGDVGQANRDRRVQNPSFPYLLASPASLPELRYRPMPRVHRFYDRRSCRFRSFCGFCRTPPIPPNCRFRQTADSVDSADFAEPSPVPLVPPVLPIPPILPIPAVPPNPPISRKFDAENRRPLIRPILLIPPDLSLFFRFLPISHNPSRSIL